MVSINTNLSSIMVQGNLNQATNGLNKAIERLSTGYKINHSSDNAANYSIANNYEAKLSSFDMAADNVGMGSDLLAVAQDTISSMQDHGARLHALITQARNGTYGAQSLNALTQEAGALISEIQRMYTNAEYNNVSLFDNIKLPSWAEEVKETAGNVTIKENGFIADIAEVTPDTIVTKASELENAISANTKIGIANADVLAELSNLVNNGISCAGKTIILTDDINLKDYQDGEGWTAIGNSTNVFKGTFDGQGHNIKNLKVDRGAENIQGLFGQISVNSVIKNLSVTDSEVCGNWHVGGIVGWSEGIVSNCHFSGTVYSSGEQAGLLVGKQADKYVQYCYTEGIINGNQIVGGLVGYVSTGVKIINSCSFADVYATYRQSGGLVGYVNSGTNSLIKNCYATGEVHGKGSTGGLVGVLSRYAKIQGCYATGDVYGTNTVGGLLGCCYEGKEISNCYATGDVKGTAYLVGGLIGEVRKYSGNQTISNVYCTGDVNGTSKIGSLIGGVTNSYESSFDTITINNAAVMSQDMPFISGTYTTGLNPLAYDMSNWFENIKEIKKPEMTLQVGIHGDESSKITFNTGFNFDLSAILHNIKSDKAYNAINKFMSTLSDKATELGSISNRLESALDSIVVNMENITSSLSTIKDADVATESSQYIKMQILQQASATLLATANQSPSIALQLI